MTTPDPLLCPGCGHMQKHHTKIGCFHDGNDICDCYRTYEVSTDRPSWDEWGLGIAEAVSTRADCSRSQVAAVLMRPDHTIVSTGYNGAPSGGPSCLAGECPRGRSGVAPLSSYDTGVGACIALHAEQNCLLRATWDEMLDATLYITRAPCDGCKRMISGTPIKHVIWPEGRLYRDVHNVLQEGIRK